MIEKDKKNKLKEAIVELECFCKVRVLFKEDFPDWPWVVTERRKCMVCNNYVTVTFLGD